MSGAGTGQGQQHGTPAAVNGVLHGSEVEQQRMRQASRPAAGGNAMPNGVVGHVYQQQQQQPQQRPPSAGPSSQGPGYPFPVASTSAGPRSPSKPPNKVRKRQRVEYDPVRRLYLEHPGTWDATQIEEVVTHASNKRPKRSVRDLGFCDVHTLKMSLRSRIGPEVAFALNSLGLLSSAMSEHQQQQQPVFTIGRHPELLEEIIDLFEEAIDGDEDGDLSSEDDTATGQPTASTSAAATAPKSAPSAKAAAKAPATEQHEEAYHDVSQDAYEEEFALKLVPKGSTLTAERFAGLDRAHVVLACLALFRNLSAVENPAKPILSDPQLVTCVLLATKTPKQVKDTPHPPSKPLNLSKTQLLQARKDALQIIGNMGHNVHLEQFKPWVSHAIISLLDYFLDLSETSSSSPPPERSSFLHAFTPGVDAALYALARIVLTDANRDVFSKLPKGSTIVRPFILSKFAVLLRLLPLSDLDFAMMTSEPALIRIEMVAMCLFNLIYIASPDTRKKLRETPGTLRILVRIIKKLYSIHLTTAPLEQQSLNSTYLVLCQRCIEVLRVLSEDEAAASAGQATTGSQEGVAWFGSYSDGRDAGEGSNTGDRSRRSLLFCKQEFVELLALPINDRSIFSALADCT